MLLLLSDPECHQYWPRMMSSLLTHNVITLDPEWCHQFWPTMSLLLTQNDVITFDPECHHSWLRMMSSLFSLPFHPDWCHHSWAKNIFDQYNIWKLTFLCLFQCLNCIQPICFSVLIQLNDNTSQTVPQQTVLCFSALRTELNIGLAKELLLMAKKALDSGQNFHIGSRCLWARHNATVCRLTNQLSAYQLKQVSTRCQAFMDKFVSVTRCLLYTS